MHSHCHHCGCGNHVDRTDKRRAGGFFATVFKLVLLYVVLVFAGGTLINTGHPVAVETGRIMHLATFVDPAIRWTDSHGWDHVNHGLQTLANGAPINR